MRLITWRALSISALSISPYLEGKVAQSAAAAVASTAAAHDAAASLRVDLDKEMADNVSRDREQRAALGGVEARVVGRCRLTLG